MSYQPGKRARVAIWLQALAAAAVLCGATVAFEFVLPDFLAESYPLRLALAFGLVQLVAITIVVFELLVSKFVVRARERRVGRVAPIIRRALVTHALGQGNWSELGRLRRRHARGFEECLIELLRSVEGPPRHRLGEVAQRFGLVDHWLQQLRSRSVPRRLNAIEALGFARNAETRHALTRALETDDQQIRQAEAHALVRNGDRADLERAFEYATTQSPWDRAVLGDVLRKYADILNQRAIPMALENSTAGRLEAALELVESWNVRLDFEVVAPLLAHDDPRISSLAFRLLPAVIDRDGLEVAIGIGLSDDSDDVRAAAAFAAGRLRLSQVIPSLAACAAGPGARSSLAAALVLAELGSSGLGVLETLAAGDDRAAALSATEAIEKARIGRLEFATS